MWTQCLIVALMLKKSECLALALLAEQNHMFAVDHVSTCKGKALAGATGAKPFNRESENLNI